jgi:hypothetical protein
MARHVERVAAEWVSQEAQRRERVVWLLIAVVFAFAGAMATAAWVGAGTISLLLLPLVLLVWRFADRRADDAIRWLRGARAERAVGELLDELEREGFVVLHDLEQFGGGNVDHLVSGPSGVFLVETKACRYELDQLRKAKRQAAVVSRALGTWVTPVIAIAERRARAPYRHHGVWIVTRREMLGWIRSRRNRTVAADAFVALSRR